MSTLVLQKGSFFNPTVSMVFPDGGNSELMHKGFSIASRLAGGTGLEGKLMAQAPRAQELVQKAIFGGFCVTGTISLYTDKLRFDPAIPAFLMPLYEGIESLSLDYSRIVSLERKRLKWIYPVLDITLRDGSCRFVTMLGGQEIHDTIFRHLAVDAAH